jgi:hypothetical protein
MIKHDQAIITGGQVIHQWHHHSINTDTSRMVLRAFTANFRFLGRHGAPSIAIIARPVCTADTSTKPRGTGPARAKA